MTRSSPRTPGRLYVTTSWDDGHPLDLRIAAMLGNHGLGGTFYVPRTAERETLTPEEIRRLATAFELGAHTMSHVELTATELPQARDEIVQSREWLESVTGAQCQMFCFPHGKFRTEHLDIVRESGFLGARTVELLSTGFPVAVNGLWLMPTTVQAHSHRAAAYLRNVVKRRALHELWRYVLHGMGRDWPDLAEAFWEDTARHGGVFHLWGHSWEIEEHGAWQRLDDILGFLGERTDAEHAVTNAKICETVAGRSIDEHAISSIG